MLYEGSKLSVQVTDGIAELCFDAHEGSVNKFDQATLEELAQAAAKLGSEAGIKGLLVTSAKPAFIVGADIMEFGQLFAGTDEQLRSWLAERANSVFSAIEDLPYPTVTAINGFALGGGLEMCLATDFRVMSEQAQVGLPETKLGIIPAFGGTVRLPRLIGADNAIEWIASGKPRKPAEALAAGAVDAVVAPDQLQAAARDLLQRAIAGEFDRQARARLKQAPLMLNRTEAAMVFQSARGQVMQRTKGMYPAPIAAVDCMQAAAGMERAGALEQETEAFIRLARGSESAAMIGLFINDQLIKKKVKQYTRQAHDIERAAVLGAGIMGGGIAYQSASRGVPIVMKDIDEGALDKGLDEAAKHFAKSVSRGRIDNQAMAAGMARIRPTLTYGELDAVDAVIEAVVENPEVKQAVLAETEEAVGDDTIIASNTSSISIDTLAEGLKRPQNFLGMHFFNPVHRMPLVEVIKGKQSSPEAIATVVSYAQKLGKTPIVVNNCPGFLVNRILFPYFFGFEAALQDGADFEQIDRVMEQFGWPMGPAYLSDVIGIDTNMHVSALLANGYPDRMILPKQTTFGLMVEAKRLGQKTGSGYYQYEPDRKGRRQKTHDDDAHTLVAQVQDDGSREFAAEEIVDRLMLPMIIEAARCLEDGIAETPNEVDMGLVLGLGFPPFRGGALRYASQLGLATVCEKAERYSHLGKLYEPTANMRELASQGKGFFD
ncbi:MAG TPA: fatty acid oxidation complex subunit alpha FadB [Salinisphaeraceae bacterium]|nr:fatty acid oxidation complex subunit alpha FadB [Salinisphaeraceae bacterium]